jgi:hypothetical protein
MRLRTTPSPSGPAGLSKGQASRPAEAGVAPTRPCAPLVAITQQRNRTQTLYTFTVTKNCKSYRAARRVAMELDDKYLEK